MSIEDPEMLEDLNLFLSRQVLISKKYNAALIDECSELVQLLIVQLAELNILEFRAYGNESQSETVTVFSQWD